MTRMLGKLVFLNLLTFSCTLVLCIKYIPNFTSSLFNSMLITRGLKCDCQKSRFPSKRGRSSAHSGHFLHQRFVVVRYAGEQLSSLGSYRNFTTLANLGGHRLSLLSRSVLSFLLTNGTASIAINPKQHHRAEYRRFQSTSET